jgi:protein TonB
MSDPRRILDERESDTRDASAALKRSMLRAARQETSIPEAQARLLAALGLDDAAVSATPPAWRERERERERAEGRWAPRPLFSSILRAEKLDPRRLGIGALGSALAHAAVFALAVHGMSGATTRRPFADEPRAMVQLTARATQPLAPGAATAPLGEPSPVRDPQAVIAPPERGDRVAAREIEGSRSGNPAVRVSSPDEIAAGADSRSPGARVVQIAGAPALAGVAGAAAQLPTSEVLPFGEGMALPRLIEGPEPVYPRAAREARVEGTLLAKCVITTEGTLRSCHIVKSLPFLDEPVLTALAQRRYAPVMFQGRPVNVEYVISLRFELP